MRRACTLLLVLSGCVGGFDNQSLRQGQVKARLTGAEAGGATVFLLGHPELRATTAADGSFTIGAVPVGTYEVVASARSMALVANVHVGPGEAATPASTALGGAPWLEVHVTRDGASVPGATLSLETTPLGASTDPDGFARLAALPPGCYALVASAEGQRRTLPVCLGGSGAEQLEIELGEAPVDAGHDQDAGTDLDAGRGADAGRELDAGDEEDAGHDLDGGHHDHDAGPADAGEPPDAGPRCDPVTGNCFDCSTADDCDGGACINHQCSPNPRPICGGCSSDPECGLGGVCLPLFPGPAVCAYGCQGDQDCQQQGLFYGYHCDSNLCLPRTDLISTCAGFVAINSPCRGDDACELAGLVGGKCLIPTGMNGGYCAPACTSDGDCPYSWHCSEVDGGAQVCREH